MGPVQALADASPQVVQGRFMTEIADQSPQVSQLRAFQIMADQSQQYQSAARLQESANQYTIQSAPPIQRKSAPVPANQGVVQRISITLPHPDISKVDPWTVDTRGKGKEYLKGWIDQAKETHPAALTTLINRLTAIQQPDDLEEYLLDYATRASQAAAVNAGMEMGTKKGSYVITATRAGNAVIITAKVDIEEDDEDEIIFVDFKALVAGKMVGKMSVEQREGVYRLTDIKTDFGPNIPRVAGLGTVLLYICTRMAGQLGANTIDLSANKEGEKDHPAPFYQKFGFKSSEIDFPLPSTDDLQGMGLSSMGEYLGMLDKNTLNMSANTVTAATKTGNYIFGAGWAFSNWRKGS
ncbi:MAG: hypothetical protein H6581_16830 [Bacteroidia bacterium]|nr:hypothetical protein [Bacteroidia bacterium]